jgi:hypothetical protein
MMKKLALGIVSLGVMAIGAYAASNASDNAGNYSNPAGWTGNGGSGWGGAWTFTTPANSGDFLGDSTTNASNPSGGINSGNGLAWGLFANTGATSDATRPFSGSLSVGQTFSLQIDQGFQDAGSTVGFGLQNASGQNLFEAYYIGGDATNSWKTNSSAGQQNLSPNVGFSGDGFNVTFTLQAGNTYAGTFSDMHGNSANFSGTLSTQAGGEAISQVRLFNSNAGNGGTNDQYFNNMSITSVPEPGTILSFLSGSSLLGAFLFIRRRRA